MEAAPLHGSFTVSIDLAAPPADVYAAFADLPTRRRWARLPGRGGPDDHALDFREGGSERIASTFTLDDFSERIERRTHFVELVPDRRLVYAYDVVIDGRRRWASLVTVVLAAQPAGTRLDWTEQYTYLEYTGDGSGDVGHLRGGTRLHLNGLAALLDPRPATGARRLVS